MPAHSNEALAHAWVKAFNAHDVNALLDLYADDARHSSPKIRALHPDTGGSIHGKAALRTWWEDALRRIPDLSYELKSVVADDARVFIEYVRRAGKDADMPVAEVFDVRGGRIVFSRVYHG